MLLGYSVQPKFWLILSLILIGILALNRAFSRLMQKAYATLDDLGREQALFLDRLPEKYLEIAIIASAALSLFLELGMIRWQGTVWEFFAFYKNLGLLSCFAGLGLGYALARRDRIPLAFAVPVLTFQMALMIWLRHGLGWQIQSLLVTPFQEQLNMGYRTASRLPHYVAVYFFIGVIFFLTALDSCRLARSVVG